MLALRSVNAPEYKYRPIRHVASLAKLLGLPEGELRVLARDSALYWIPGKTMVKKNGDLRPTSNARPPLKKIHRKIVDGILRRVYYPTYLMGGIPSDHAAGCIRHYEENARQHSGKAIVIGADIKSFYPSIPIGNVKRIWSSLFGFSPQVTDLLTQLVTYKGEVPQGWAPSSYLANLSLWDVEPAIVDWFENGGWTYTRWIDDITISNRNFTGPRGKKEAIAKIYGMLISRGFRPNRKKYELMTSGSRQKIMGRNVVAPSPTVTKKERAVVRAMVRNLDRERMTLDVGAYRERRQTVLGEIGRLKRLHPQLSAKLRAEVLAIAT